jgi:hypothetical protein
MAFEKPTQLSCDRRRIGHEARQRERERVGAFGERSKEKEGGGER